MLSRLKRRMKPAIAFLAAGAFILSGFPVYAEDSDQLEVTCSDYEQEVLIGSDSQEYMNSLAVYMKNSGSQPVDLSEYEVRIIETSGTGSLLADPAVKDYDVEPGEEAAVYVNYAVAEDCTAEKITYKAEITEKDGTNHFESKEYTLIPFSVKDGVLKYNDASRQSKYRLQFEGDAHASFDGLIYGGDGNATEIRHQDGTIEYYLQPGAESSCSYSLDDGYEIGSFTLDPEDAGTAHKILGLSAVDVDLKAPAVLKVTSREAIGDQEVYMPDPVLRQGILDYLRVYEGIKADKLTVELMESLTYFTIDDEGVQDLTGLETAVNLEGFSLNNQKIKDLSPIAGLTKLKHVSLMNNQIEDISVLEQLPNLESASLTANPVGEYVFEKYVDFPDMVIRLEDGKTAVAPKSAVFGLGIAEMTFEVSDKDGAVLEVEQSSSGNDCNIIPKKAGTADVKVTYKNVSKTFTVTVMEGDEIPDTNISIVSGNGFSISAPATAERIEGFPKLQLSVGIPENAEETKDLITDWLGKTDKINVYQMDVSGTEDVQSGLDIFKPEVTVTIPVPDGWDISRIVALSINQYGIGYVASELSKDGKSISLDTEMYGNSASNQFAVVELSVPTEVKEWDKVVKDYIGLMRVITWGNGEEIFDLCFEKTPSADVAAYLTYSSNSPFKYNYASDYYNKEKSQMEIPYDDLKSEAEKLFESVPDMTSVDLGYFIKYDSQSSMFVIPSGGVGDPPLVTEVVKVNKLESGTYSIWFKVSNETMESNPDMSDPSQYAEYTLTVRDNGEGNWKYVSFVQGFTGSEDPEKPTESEQTSGSGSQGTNLPENSIDSIVQNIQGCQDGNSVTVDMGAATVVPARVLEAAKGKDVDIVLQMDGYTWTINGKDITASQLKDINLEVKENVNAIDPDIVDQLADGRPAKQISLTYDGEFGFTAELRIYVGTDYEGQYGNLFWCRNGKYFSYIDSGIIDPEGYVSFTMNHASDYVIVIDQKEMSQNDIPEALRFIGSSVQTGDTADVIPLSVIVLLALVSVVIVIKMKRGYDR